jgi:hypothetical protein
MNKKAVNNLIIVGILLVLVASVLKTGATKVISIQLNQFTNTPGANIFQIRK